MDESKKFTEWHGVKREEINWSPSVISEKCIGCGLCVTTCGRGVYKFDYEKRKTKVVNPGNCLVACQTCANLCPVAAIRFTEAKETTREKAQKIVSKTKVLPKVRQELENRRAELSV